MTEITQDQPAAGYARTCRECAHCADIHGQPDLIYCEAREKNKHPNYAAQCESFVRHAAGAVATENAERSQKQGALDSATPPTMTP